jgi:hypothetical protein
MPGLVPGSHDLTVQQQERRGRVKPGHDEKRIIFKRWKGPEYAACIFGQDEVGVFLILRGASRGAGGGGAQGLIAQRVRARRGRMTGSGVTHHFKPTGSARLCPRLRFA